MFKKTAIALSLAMVAGTALAADDSMSHDQMSHDNMSQGQMSHDQMSHDSMSQGQMGHDHDNMSHGGDMDVGEHAGMSMDAQFDALDTNHDGAISRSEARASSKLSAMYDSLDTSATIENPSKDSNPAGITKDQFEAGLQAASNGGVVGPAVSGGGMHPVMKSQGDNMSHDSMGEGGMSHDSIGKDSMSHDQMGHGDSMKKQ